MGDKVLLESLQQTAVALDLVRILLEVRVEVALDDLVALDIAFDPRGVEAREHRAVGGVSRRELLAVGLELDREVLHAEVRGADLVVLLGAAHVLGGVLDHALDLLLGLLLAALRERQLRAGLVDLTRGVLDAEQELVALLLRFGKEEVGGA